MLKTLLVNTAGTALNKTTVNVEPGAMEGAKRYYMTAPKAESLTAVTYGTAITTSGWTELTANGAEITPTSGHAYIRVVEVDSASKPIAVGTTVINYGSV